MNSEAASDNAARQGGEVYQAAAREAWRTAESSGLLRLTVTSDSMRPLLRAGDTVVVQPSEPRAVQPGAVMVVQRGGEWITHRLVTIDERGWHTHGDNTRYADEAATADEIVGRVIAIERGDQTIDLQQPRWAAIDRRINRVQRGQLRLLAAAQQRNGTRSNRWTRALAALINWPFQLAVRLLARP
jgi:signal peptidase I